MAERSAKRIWAYRIIAGTMLTLLVVALINEIVDLKDSINTNGYELNQRINQRNQNYAKANSLGFTDCERSPQKPKGIYRIAVLGDSFIWGDGLPYEKVWSHKLERSLLAQYDSVEVISWGHCGWSTLDEFNFFKEHGKDFDINLLLIAWVDNDPDVGKIPQNYNTNPKGTYPLRYLISPAWAQSMVNKDNFETGLAWWKGIYSDQNLKDYQLVLHDFKKYLDENNVRSVVVMTTSGFWEGGLRHFNLAKPLITNAGFPCLDLYEPAEKKFGKLPPEAIHANPVNTHPGDLLTEEFAKDVEDYLKQNHYLDSQHLKVK